MADSDNLDLIGFRITHSRKRAARMLAAKLDLDDVSDLMRFLLDREIKKYLPDEAKAIETEDLKAGSRRQARRKAG